MRGDQDGPYPPQMRDPWGTDARPPSYLAQSRPAGPTPGPAYGELPTERMVAAVPTAGRPIRGRNVPAFLRPPTVWFTGIAGAGLVFILVMVLASLPAPTPRITTTEAAATATATSIPSPTAQPTATVQPLPVFSLPAFHDWRAAYLAADGKVHVSSLDGQSDIVGPAVALNTADTTNSTVTPGFVDTYQSHTSMSVSPNGQYLAYIDEPPRPSGAGIAPPTGDLILISLTANAGWRSIRIPSSVSHIGGWSPDSQTIAYSTTSATGAAGIYTLSLSNESPRPIPGQDTNGVLASSHILGWIDASHLALEVSSQNGYTPPPLPGATPPPGGTPSGMLPQPVAHSAPAASGREHGAAPLNQTSAGPPAALLATVDINTGTAYTIARLRQGAQVALSPDGTQVVAQNNCVGVCADAPLVTEVIDTRTGSVRKLPTSDAAINPTANFIWNPHADTFAATVEPSAQAPANWKVSLVDAQHDSVQTMRTGAFAIGWSPDGGTLVVGDAAGLGRSSSSTKVWLVATITGSAAVPLPQPVVAFIGFVRTS